MIKKLFILSLLALSLLTLGNFNNKTYALTGSEFQAGRIIEDSVFFNPNTMDANTIQQFLNAKVPTCETWHAPGYGQNPPFICLKDYTQSTPSEAFEPGLCNAYTGGVKSAAQIIYDVSQVCGINPKVLIVLLQKEQSLVTDTWPLSLQYRSATGYGCPDTAACDAEYYGFFNQVYMAARQFKKYMRDSSTYRYRAYRDNYIQYNPNPGCGGTNVYIHNQATAGLYNYTPYQPNPSALANLYGLGDGCGAYGNRNFWRLFGDWFGFSSGPAAFKSPNSSTVYVPVNGYKLAVPHTAVMQDYGISIEAVQTVAQSYVDSIPSPSVDTGISTSIGSVIKSTSDSDEDGGALYLVSRGKRYHVQGMQQFYNFGFTESDITYLPLNYLNSMSYGGPLSSFVTSPYGNVFKVGAQKQIIFEYSTYITQNPSDTVTPLSYYLVDKIPSGNPLIQNPSLIKQGSSPSVNLYSNSNYYSIPDYDVFRCWGFDNAYRLPIYTVPQSNYIASFTHQSALSCIVNDGSTNQTLSDSARYTIPSQLGLPSVSATTSDLRTIFQRLPLRSAPLKSYLKGYDSPSVWFADSGSRRLVPTFSTFSLLGLGVSDIDVVSPSVINLLTSNGIKLAEGGLVKDSSSSSVYVIGNNERILYPSGDLFLAYRNSWGSIETYSQAQLDQYYPNSGDIVSDILVDKTNSKMYIIGSNGCFLFNNDSLTKYGLTYSTFANNQSYESSSFRYVNLPACQPVNSFIKQKGQSLVYWIDSGQKHSLNTYSAMLAKNNGTSPQVIEVNSNFLSSIPTGSSLY